ncbi:MAG: S-layer homology domain-containing protein [Eubacteriales bacterium]
MIIRSKLMTVIVVLLLLASFILTTGFTFVSMVRQASPVAASLAPAPEFPFADAKGNWAEAAIAEMYAKDVIKGYNDNSFKPKKPVTFLEAVVMLDKMLWGKPISIDISSDYLHEQFNIPEWAVGYISSAMRNNIMSWNELQKASREQPLTRQDAALLAIRALELTKQAKAKTDITLPFSDLNQINESMKGYITVAYERRIINGYPDGTFQPNGPISRAETAILLSNIALQIPSVNADEIAGFVKSTDLQNTTVSLVYGVNREARIKLPEQCLIYFNDAPSTIAELSAGNHIRIITSESAKLTVVLADAAVPDSGTSIVMTPVDYTTAPLNLQQWVETNKISESYVAGTFNGGLYFMATRGEKMYMGYSVEITRVSISEDQKGINYRIWLDRSDPGRNAVKLPRISYPFAMVRVDLPSKSIGTVTFVDRFNEIITEVKLPR